ncbi:MAG: amidohydrolase family protein [Phycisphaerales bacterium]|jgi:predicted TIM-barrel fold metal-dependent hydrolase|nr:amidohydrolase family protein [Phycisphaerales bacterium]
MQISEIQAIDIHGHYGRNDRPGRPLAIQFQSADPAEVVRRARQCNTRYTVVSPLLGLMPRGGSDPVAGNDQAARVVAEYDDLLQWVIVDPLHPRTFEQADAMLKSPKCVGIKIHPEEHCYPIREHGDKLFAFFAQRRALVLTHSGDQNSMPGDFVPFADAHPEMKLILAHIGNGWDRELGHQVRAVAASRHGNLYADTSSASSIVPNLIEWAVHEIGANRVLYGTDTPLYSASMQRIRIDRSELGDNEKYQILRGNAAKLLNLPAD